MPNIQEEFASLTKLRDEQSKRAMRINVTVEEAKRRHAGLLDQAKEKYGVKSVDELREKLAAMKKENAEAVVAFRSALEMTEKKLVEAEAIIANAVAPTPSGARA
jgi:predicted Zn-dependent protease